MKQLVSVKIILLCIGFLIHGSIKSQTITVSDMMKMTSLSKEDMVKYLQKNYTYVNKVLPDSTSNSWHCTRVTYGGVAEYTYSRDTGENKKTIISLTMTYENLFNKLKEEVKAMKMKQDDDAYENDKYLIIFWAHVDKRPYTYTVEVGAK